MGQKVHPIGFRLGVIKTWDSRWYSKKNYAALLHEDIKIRKIVKERLMHAGVSKIEIERAGQKAKNQCAQRSTRFGPRRSTSFPDQTEVNTPPKVVA